MSVIRSRRDLPLTEAAGWTAVALGASHRVITAVTTRRTWSQIRSQGCWNTVSLARDETLRDSRRSTVFWQTVGSFGIPMAGLGDHMSGRRGTVCGCPGG